MHQSYHIDLIPTSHWDREWYRSLSEFSFFSAELYEDVLDKLKSGELDYFHSDGQTVVINDLQENFPDLYNQICHLAQKGKVEVGPWYSLSDMLLPSGESLIRNLMFGVKDIHKMGAKPAVPYSPDAFGHNTDMPAILNTMGFDKYYFCRGLGDHLDKPKSEFIWKSADENYKVLVIAGLTDVFTPAFDTKGKWVCGAYALGMCLPHDKAELQERLQLIITHFKTTSDYPRILAMCGSDHLLPQEKLNKIIGCCNTEINGISCKQNTLSGHFAEFIKCTNISSLPSP